MSQTPLGNKEAKKKPRLFSIDALRGLIIIFMALDHANYFIAQKHSSGEYWGGTFPHYDNALSFLTRFVTHFSAPGFFFLMGVGMLLFADSRQKQGWSKAAVIRHFLIRGTVLIGLQLLIVNRAWELSPGGWSLEVYIGVLFALGGTMIISSFFLWLKPRYLFILSVVLLIGTELLHPAPHLWGQLSFVDFFDNLNVILVYPSGTTELWSNYPILPWLELVVFGILFANWLLNDRRQAFDIALKLGLALLAAFAVVRYLDGFGNIRPREGNTWVDFLNTVKYPPAITFTLMTTGVNLILLNLFSKAREKAHKFLQPLVVFGQSPLFFYVLHLFFYAGLALWLTPDGTSIPAMYPYWLVGLVILYPLCLWYGKLKRDQPANSILRFL